MNSQEEKNRKARILPPEGLVSPFLEGELFTRETGAEWEARLAALEAESPFRQAFEETPGHTIEPEFQEEDWADKGEETEADLFYAAENFEDTQNAVLSELYEAPIESEVFGTNDMDGVADTLTVPHRWICRLDIEYEITPWNTTRKLSGRGRGTGTLIGPCHVLTAAHNVTGYDPVQKNYLKAVRIRVTAAHDGSASPPIPTVDVDLPKSFIHPRWTVPSRVGTGGAPNPAGEVETNRYDYALLTLKRPIGLMPVKALGNRALGYWTRQGSGGAAYFERLEPNILRSNRVFISGYGDDPCVMAVRSARSNSAIPLGSQLMASGQLTLIMEGTKNRYVGRSMAHDVDTCGGQSGAPVWIKRNGIYYLVGVHTGSVGLTGGGRTNHAVRVTTELVQQINQWITKTRCPEQLDKSEREETLDTGTPYTEEAPDDHVDNEIKEHEREHDKAPVDYDESSESEDDISFSNFDEWDQAANENEVLIDEAIEDKAPDTNFGIYEFEEKKVGLDLISKDDPKVTDGQFGLELGYFLKNIVSEIRIGNKLISGPMRLVMILKLSRSFINMARQLDNEYVSSRHRLVLASRGNAIPELRFDQNYRIARGEYRGGVC